MRKALSKSALISAFLAAPLLTQASARAASVDAAAATEMQAHLTAMTGGPPMDAQRMQALQRRILDGLRARIALAHPSRLFLVTDDAPQTVRPVDPTSLPPQPSGELVQPTEKAAFIGVATTEVPALLRDQLKLPRGIGLVVQFVVNDSPAAHAGLHPNDILEKLDDQQLINGQQFAVLVRTKNPGDSVALTLIRAGQPVVLTVKLGEKEMPILDDAPPFRPPPPLNWQGSLQFRPLQGQPGLIAVPIDGGPGWERGVRKTVVTSPDGAVTRTLIDGENQITLTTAPDGNSDLLIQDKNNAQQYRGPYTTDAQRAKVPPQFAAEVKDLLSSSSRVTIENLTAKPAGAVPPSAVKLMRADPDHQITLTIDANGKSALVTDAKTGKVIYEGPANSDQDFNTMPPPIAEKVKAMESKIHIRN